MSLRIGSPERGAAAEASPAPWPQLLDDFSGEREALFPGALVISFCSGLPASCRDYSNTRMELPIPQACPGTEALAL